MLRNWLSEAAATAAANAAKAEAQAAANELARLTMPNLADIAAIQAVQRSLTQIGAALGAPVQAIAAATDSDADVAKATASRVMRTYEAATEPLAMPWVQDQPPVLTPGTALAAEQAAAAAAQPTPALPGGMPMMPPGFSMGPLSVAPVQTAYRAPVYAESGVSSEELEPQPIPVSTPDATVSVPGAMAPGAGAPAMDSESEHRAGLTPEGADVIGLDNGIVSAPAVLGGSASTAPAPTTQQTAAGSGAA
jgi:hypothetical protein